WPGPSSRRRLSSRNAFRCWSGTRWPSEFIHGLRRAPLKLPMQPRRGAKVFHRAMGGGSQQADELSALADFRHRKPPADLPGQDVGDFCVSRDGFRLTRARVGPDGVATSFPLKHTAVEPQVTQKGAGFHPTVTVARMAVAGAPR